MRALRCAPAYWFLVCAACGHQDIRGRSDEARAWAEQDRREQERSKQRAQSRRHPIAEPEPRPALPEQAPPPRGTSPRAPAPQSPHPSPGAARSPTGKTNQIGVGTCFAIDGRGTLVTAQHVLRGARAVAVRLSDGTVVDAAIGRASESTDVALLKVDRATKDFLTLASHGVARVGARVFTVGYPDPELLGTEPKFTDGSISSLSGIGGDSAALQMTVPIQPGNSGGPLLDDRGEVVGVVVARAADGAFYERSGALPQNVNFASKSENVRTLLAAEPARATPARDREQAIERALRAVCLVLTLQ